MLTGSLFAVLSAACLGLHNAVARRGILTGTPLQALSISLPVGAIVCLAATIAFGQAGALIALPGTALVWFALSGIVQFVISRYLFYRATAAMGGNLSGIVLQCEMVFALLISIIVLDEKLTPIRLLGIALLFVGPLLLVRWKNFSGQTTVTDQDSESWKPKYMEGFFFAGLSSVGYGASFVLAKLGMNELSSALNASIAASLVSFISATCVLIALLIITGQHKNLSSIDKSARFDFLLASMMAGLAVIFRYAALALVPVSIVAPIKRLSSISTIIFSTILNRRYEVFDTRVILAAGVSFCGALCTVLSSETIMSALGL